MEDLKQLEQQVKDLDNKVSGMDDKLSDILILLTGNVMDKDDVGFVGKFNKLEKRVTILEKYKDRAIWALVGMSFPAGVGAWELLNKFLHS